MSYFISQEEDRGWRFDAGPLIERLAQRWPGAEVEEISDQARTYSHEWTINASGGRLDGMIHRAGTSLVLEGSPESAAEFAAWYQNDVVRAPRDLMLYDEQYVRIVPLGPGVREDEIVRILRE